MGMPKRPAPRSRSRIVYHHPLLRRNRRFNRETFLFALWCFLALLVVVNGILFGIKYGWTAEWYCGKLELWRMNWQLWSDIFSGNFHHTGGCGR
jgi:hypothetical protein